MRETYVNPAWFKDIRKEIHSGTSICLNSINRGRSTDIHGEFCRFSAWSSRLHGFKNLRIA